MLLTKLTLKEVLVAVDLKARKCCCAAKALAIALLSTALGIALLSTDTCNGQVYSVCLAAACISWLDHTSAVLQINSGLGSGCKKLLSSSSSTCSQYETSPYSSACSTKYILVCIANKLLLKTNTLSVPSRMFHLQGSNCRCPSCIDRQSRGCDPWHSLQCAQCKMQDSIQSFTELQKGVQCNSGGLLTFDLDGNLTQPVVSLA